MFIGVSSSSPNSNRFSGDVSSSSGIGNSGASISSFLVTSCTGSSTCFLGLPLPLFTIVTAGSSVCIFLGLPLLFGCTGSASSLTSGSCGTISSNMLSKSAVFGVSSSSIFFATLGTSVGFTFLILSVFIEDGIITGSVILFLLKFCFIISKFELSLSFISFLYFSVWLFLS